MSTETGRTYAIALHDRAPVTVKADSCELPSGEVQTYDLYLGSELVFSAPKDRVEYILALPDNGSAQEPTNAEAVGSPVEPQA